MQAREEGAEAEVKTTLCHYCQKPLGEQPGALVMAVNGELKRACPLHRETLQAEWRAWADGKMVASGRLARLP